tara:strand:+ start:493 stop:2127 length:1635 start_codon:yes stop_codon:yes gene_type:complete
VSELLLREWTKEVLFREASLSGAGGLVKYIDRLELMKERIEQDEPFYKINGQPYVFSVKTQATQDLIAYLSTLINDYTVNGNPIREAADPRYAQLYDLIESAGVKLTQLLKDDKGMGGEGSEKRLSKETKQIKEINESISAAIKAESLNSPKGQSIASIRVEVAPGNVVEVDGVIKIGGTPKADCALTYGDTHVAFISLKGADAPNDMGQWSGITTYQNNSEVAKFIADLYLLQATGKSRLDTGYFRESTDEVLNAKCVYGKDYSGGPGINSCDCVLASKAPLSLEKTGDIYRFKSTHIFYKPQIPSGEWHPTLYARFATGRNDAGLNEVRLSMSPLGYRKNREDLPAFDASIESVWSEAGLNLDDLIVPEEDYYPEIEDVYTANLDTGDAGLVSWEDMSPEEQEQAMQRQQLAAGKMKVLRNLIRETLLTEELTKSDKKEIEKIARQQATVIVDREVWDKKEIEKLAKKQAEDAIKKALGVSFIGTKGDINKFVSDATHDYAEKWIKDKATQQKVADIAKRVMKRLYKELAMSSPQIIDRIKV